MQIRKMNFQAKFLLILSVYLAVGFLALPVLAGAQTETGFENICSPEAGITVCIQQIYVLSLGLGSIVAVFMLILAGYRYMTSGGNAQQVQNAKEAFASAFIGLIILFVAVLLLRLINPELTRFEKLSLPEIEIPEPGGSE